jgi:hypothetical protein
LLRDSDVTSPRTASTSTARIRRRSPDGTIRCFFTETTGIEQLTRLMSRLEQIRGVLTVGRNRLTAKG